MDSGNADAWLRLLREAFPSPQGRLGEVVRLVRERIEQRLRPSQAAAQPAIVAADLQAWFLAQCVHEDAVTKRVVDLSHRRRQDLASAFNQIAAAAVRAGLLPPGSRVYNYPRQKRSLVHDPEVLLAYPLSAFVGLCRWFVERTLARGRAGGDDDPAWDAWCGMAFALIALGGVCWEGAFASVVRLRACHLAHLGQNAIVVPQARGNQGAQVVVEGDAVITPGWVRVHLSPFVALCIASAACYRARPAVVSRHRALTALHPGADLLPDSRGEKGPRLGDLPVESVRRRFDRWLERLCAAAGQPLLTVRTLARLARDHLWLAGVYPEPVLAALLGLTPYNPVPLDELAVFEGYTGLLDIPPWPDSVKGAPGGAAAPRPSDAPSRGPLPQPKAVRAYAPGIAALQAAVRPFVRGGGARDEAAAALRRFAAEQLTGLGVAVDDSDAPGCAGALRRAYLERVQPALAAGGRGEDELARLRPFNLAAGALYLADRVACPSLDPLTIAARRSDLTAMLRLFPAAALTELDGTALETLLALDQAAATKQRVRGTLRQLRRFLGDALGVSLPPLETEHWPRASVTHTVHLPAIEDVAALLAAFAAGGTAMERNAYLGVCLAFEAGLRASEVVALRLQDVAMLGGFIEVRDSKFGKSRRVSLQGVSERFLESLARIRNQRWRESDRDPLAPLCADADGRPISADALSRIVTNVMHRLGLRGDPTTGEPVTFHRLRHGAVCRRLLRGVPPPLVARWVGHATPAVTVEVYAHHWDWAQREWLQQYGDPRLPASPYLRPATLAALMDLSPQAVKAALGRSEGLRRVPVSAAEGTAWGLRRDGGSETRVVPMADALRLVVTELREGKVIPSG